MTPSDSYFGFRFSGKILILLAAIVLTFGCRSYPRYRTGGAETPRETAQAGGYYTTNDNLRLGAILRSYLGKPYTGRSRYVQGLDCSFFTSEVFEKFDNLDLPRTVKDQFQFGREVNRRRLGYADLVFFKTTSAKVGHVGIFVGDGRFMHASTSRGVIISAMGEKYWARRFVGARRILDKRSP